MHEVLVDFRISSRPVLESRAADKAQLATLEREHRRRPRPLIDHSEFAYYCTGAKYGQDPVFAQQRGYDDLQQALLELIATVARFSDHKKRFISFELTPSCSRKNWSRQGGWAQTCSVYRDQCVAIRAEWPRSFSVPFLSLRGRRVEIFLIHI